MIYGEFFIVAGLLLLYLLLYSAIYLQQYELISLKNVCIIIQYYTIRLLLELRQDTKMGKLWGHRKGKEPLARSLIEVICQMRSKTFGTINNICCKGC